MEELDFSEFKRPIPDVQALVTMMREWLRSVVIDAGTDVDSGIGFGAADLWFKMGGREIYVHIQGK